MPHTQTTSDSSPQSPSLLSVTQSTCITFNLQSQYELYLTRTWSPTAAALPLQPMTSTVVVPSSSGGGGLVLMEVNQSVSGLPATQSVVYKCPSPVNANPQLNIQLPQYYRHSNVDSCSPAKYNQLAPQQIILSRDATHYYGMSID